MKVAGGHGTDAWVYCCTGGGGFQGVWIRDRHAPDRATILTSLTTDVGRPHRLAVGPGGRAGAGWVNWWPGGGGWIERGFHAVHRTEAGPRPYAFSCGECAVPAWAPLILFGVLPVVHAVLAYRAWRRPMVGHCRRCGYDLRASPDTCPECGRPVVAATAT